MATTPEQIAALRGYIHDDGTTPEFSAPDLAAYIEAAGGDVRKAAGTVWGVKASRLANLVDVTEGSSSRKLGSLYKQALDMSTFYGGDAAGTVATAGRSGTRAITRP